MLGLILAVNLVVAGDFVVEPREMSWASYSAQWFDTGRVLLPLPAGAARDYLEAFKQAGQAGALGDLVTRLDADAAQRDRLLRQALADPPAALRPIRPWLGGLLNDARLTRGDWNPDEDEDDDGLQHGPSFDAADIDRYPWNRLSGTTTVHTCAVFVNADLDAIKAAENDYRAYYDNIGATYEEIYPVATGYVRGVEQGAPFAGTAIYFRSDLPFPFSTYSCDLRTLSRLDADGRLVTDIYSTGEDFYWLAGRDIYVPVLTGAKDWVGTLVLRMYGFDLKGVPDSEENRRAALRSSLGHLKLRAERLFRAAGGQPRTVAGAIPPFTVSGRR